VSENDRFLKIPLAVHDKMQERLSSKAKDVYLLFLRKQRFVPKLSPRRLQKGKEAFEFPYSKAEQQGISRRIFKKCIKELVDGGFLKLYLQGDYQKKDAHRNSNKYRLILF